MNRKQVANVSLKGIHLSAFDDATATCDNGNVADRVSFKRKRHDRLNVPVSLHVIGVHARPSIFGESS